VSDPPNGWLAWQHDHAEALAALQEAQRAYHRTVVERALASRRQPVGSLLSAVDSPGSKETPAANVRQALDAVDAARVRLDAVRARKPE
jgi:hypothetical protein